MDSHVIISDTQIPYHDVRAVNGLIRFIHSWQPDSVTHIGDLMDYPQPSTWSRDTRKEYEGSIYVDSEIGKRFLDSLRKGYDGPIRVIEGNHDLRPAHYLNKHAPALVGDDHFNIENLLDFDSFGIEVVRGFYDFAPGWTMTHGHLGFTLSQIGGRTALLAAEAMGVSVIMGHTHRLGLIGKSMGREGNLTTRWGLEVGHLMDVKKAEYIMTKGGRANWQQGFGIAYVDGDNVTPIPVPMHKDGSFYVNGYEFSGVAA
jgi:predicted phosphodiesterase